MRISKHISWTEATVSPTALRNGIKNEPTPEILANMRRVANEVFEPLREWWGKPIRINSFYRSPELNAILKGSKNSQHMTGEAIDISTGDKANNKQLFDYVKDNLDFDQLIDEYNFQWVHISKKKTGNRKQILKVG
jgi:zinc D-Ala-D-Ala carboxypeptidase